MKKPSVILISGWAHGAEAMNPLAEAMADSHAVTSLSLSETRRKIEDENGPGEVGISDYARTVGRRLDGLGGPACIVGWSTGSIVAIEVAANHPEKIAGLVLLSATARFCSEKSLRRPNGAHLDALEGYKAGIDPAVLRAMIRGLKRSPAAVISDFLSKALYPMNIPANELAGRAGNALRQGTASLIEGLEYLARVDLRAALPSLTFPCLIIHGRRDRIVPWEAAQYLGSNLSVSNVEFMHSAGHSLIEQCGKNLINRIVQFTESLK